MIKYTLVPKEFFSEEAAAGLLSATVLLDEKDSVKNMELPSYEAVLVYTGDDSRALAISEMVKEAACIDKYNKVLARLGDGFVDILVAEGKKLLLVNTFPAADLVTAQYFIFASLRQFQVNPEVTTIYFLGDTPDSIMEDLFRYFKSVELI